MTGFIKLGIRSELNHQLKEHGIFEPTPIQEQTIPVLLKGKDVIAQAQTGTGKTMAFILPILERIDPASSHVQALIVAPTRELALQLTTEARKMVSAIVGVDVLAVYGGQDVEKQIKKLQGAKQIVIGTPGRILDHVRRQTLDLSGVNLLVLDEADQMLQMGFLTEVEEVIKQTGANRQTMLFSATMPEQIRILAKRYMTKPVQIHVKSEQITLGEIKQLVVETTDRAKQNTLFQLIDQFRPFLAVIFCRTKRRASKLNEALLQHGYDSDELHGDLSQAKREQVMHRFREAKIQLLVATDVAARGLDVDGVTHVFNYDIPHDVESYIHRIGRTGRAGEWGMAVTLVAAKDLPYLTLIEKGIHLSIKKKKMEMEIKTETQQQSSKESFQNKGRRPFVKRKRVH